DAGNNRQVDTASDDLSAEQPVDRKWQDHEIGDDAEGQDQGKVQVPANSVHPHGGCLCASLIASLLEGSLASSGPFMLGKVCAARQIARGACKKAEKRE